jgi:hypothetical protein
MIEELCRQCPENWTKLRRTVRCIGNPTGMC